MMIISSMTTTMKVNLTTTANKIAHKVNKENPTVLPDPSAIVSSIIKGYLDSAEGTDMMDKLGLTKETQQTYVHAFKQIAPLDTLFQNIWREKIDSTEFTKQFRKLGYDSDQQSYFTNLLNRIPPIQDIIRFAVREAFRDDLSELYGHDEEFPLEVAKWAKQQGFPEYWAKKYWRAHWELPSVQLVFQMMHRGICTQTDLDNLLKMADYPVGWRDKISAVSYRVLSRVDVRRMYRIGVFNGHPTLSPEELVHKAYTDLGYNEQHAIWMTDFTVKFTYESRRAISNAGLKRLRKRGIITEETLREKLIESRLLDQDIDLIICFQ